MTVKVGINGFGRIGRLVYSPIELFLFFNSYRIMKM
ncbi:hypothetical protein GC097_11715 [Paenibacillus sp. LMG 31457]|uniref:Glyceraldehyde-3-phosphate dehydrogenase n=1 Tax=Paenibacillus planticolens TaxID=2654976 RepID=A0ABX1ZL23_9BACL|nr:hypothetical protein [Paenibacillus planticolens]